MKKELPIICQTEMVQSIDNRSKEQTRRTRNLNEINKDPDKWEIVEKRTYHDELLAIFYNASDKIGIGISCPYGRPGDTLWVREKWQYTGDQNWQDAMFDDWDNVWYYATADEHAKEQLRWKPSIHMPKRLARIWIEVTGVRVERLQDISEIGAIKEGIKSFRPVPGDGSPNTLYYHYTKDKWGPSPIHSFETLWTKINGPGSWEHNPWVWVIHFKKIDL